MNIYVNNSHHVIEIIDQCNFRYLKNAAYYPDGNGIEHIFSLVKGNFKKLRLKSILNGKPDRPRDQLKKSFGQVSIQDCAKAIENSFKNINNF